MLNTTIKSKFGVIKALKGRRAFLFQNIIMKSNKGRYEDTYGHDGMFKRVIEKALSRYDKAL